MNPRILKYILDIERIISEIDTIKERVGNDFSKFDEDVILKRAVERDLEIIGEAVRNLVVINPEIKISSTKKIIGMRNLINHAYDSIEAEIVWGIIQKDIPILKKEVAALKS